ncbi:MAG: hypothetical protein K9N46_13220 [Candidatus Marinimicrobia bacterium]|nr:hypothetical protein [Candidatus Neomarinimicrobiota bacterium]MCF7829743.1 hypothetical protein [Candidatus Neomarinimicrobiota bacterium]MCF7881693.1 hypothetical protein [Candidatus Neomarinimicrobiota bacterium]
MFVEGTDFTWLDSAYSTAGYYRLFVDGEMDGANAVYELFLVRGNACRSLGE